MIPVPRRLLLRTSVGSLVMAAVPGGPDRAWIHASAASLPPWPGGGKPVYNTRTSTGYPTISAAISAHNALGASGPAETILVAGPGVPGVGKAVYTEHVSTNSDYPNIQGGPLTLQSYGGMVRLAVPNDSPTNGKAVLVFSYAGPYVVNGFEFSNNTGGSGNVAGIRWEGIGGTLTVRNCYFHDNQDGILTAAGLLTSSTTIDHCWFDHNGSEAGLEHNLYVGDHATLTITNSLFTRAIQGHEIKSRATNNIIHNNRIYDGSSDTSYCIDLPNSNNADIQHNVMEKGINSGNDAIIHYGGEVPNPIDNPWVLTIKNNVIIDNHRPPAHGVNLLWSQAVRSNGAMTAVPTITGNAFFGLHPGYILLWNDRLQPGTPYADPVNKFYLIGQQPAPLDYSSPCRPSLAAVPEPAPVPRTGGPVRKP